MIHLYHLFSYQQQHSYNFLYSYHFISYCIVISDYSVTLLVLLPPLVVVIIVVVVVVVVVEATQSNCIILMRLIIFKEVEIYFLLIEEVGDQTLSSEQYNDYSHLPSRGSLMLVDSTSSQILILASSSRGGDLV